MNLTHTPNGPTDRKVLMAIRNALASLDQADGKITKEDADDFNAAYNALARIDESNKEKP